MDRPGADARAGWLFIVHGSVPEANDHMQRIARAVHGEARLPQPGISELIPALHEHDVYPNVITYERRCARSYADEAARQIASTLLIEQSGEASRRVRALLEPDLRVLPDGRVALPAVTAPQALLIWRTAGRAMVVAGGGCETRRRRDADHANHTRAG